MQIFWFMYTLDIYGNLIAFYVPIVCYTCNKQQNNNDRENYDRPNFESIAV